MLAIDDVPVICEASRVTLPSPRRVVLTSKPEPIMPFAEACSPEHRIAIAIGAARLGISKADYRRHVAAGEKWCYACQRWQKVAEFGVRRSKQDGLNNICKRAETDRVIAYQRRRRGQVAS